MAAKPVLGLSEMRPPLLDDVPHATRCRSCRTGRRGKTPRRITVRRFPMNTSPSDDDEDEEVLEDEEFDEDAERDSDDEDSDDEDDDEDEEEEETWQVVAVCRSLTS